MPKWKKDQTEFIVGLNFNPKRGYQSSLPRPVVKALGNPDKIKFTILKNSIQLLPVKK